MDNALGEQIFAGIQFRDWQKQFFFAKFNFADWKITLFSRKVNFADGKVHSLFAGIECHFRLISFEVLKMKI